MLNIFEDCQGCRKASDAIDNAKEAILDVMQSVVFENCMLVGHQLSRSLINIMHFIN